MLLFLCSYFSMCFSFSRLHPLPPSHTSTRHSPAATHRTGPSKIYNFINWNCRQFFLSLSFSFSSTLTHCESLERQIMWVECPFIVWECFARLRERQPAMMMMGRVKKERKRSVWKINKWVRESSCVLCVTEVSVTVTSSHSTSKKSGHNDDFGRYATGVCSCVCMNIWNW